VVWAGTGAWAGPGAPRWPLGSGLAGLRPGSGPGPTGGQWWWRSPLWAGLGGTGGCSTRSPERPPAGPAAAPPPGCRRRRRSCAAAGPGPLAGRRRGCPGRSGPSGATTSASGCPGPPSPGAPGSLGGGGERQDITSENILPTWSGKNALLSKQSLFLVFQSLYVSTHWVQIQIQLHCHFASTETKSLYCINLNLTSLHASSNMIGQSRYKEKESKIK
jgi:hypothetical protein